jgi:hypothetical protein
VDCENITGFCTLNVHWAANRVRFETRWPGLQLRRVLHTERSCPSLEQSALERVPGLDPECLALLDGEQRFITRTELIDSRVFSVNCLHCS